MKRTYLILISLMWANCIVLLSLLTVGCIMPLQIKKQVIPVTPTVAEPVDKNVNIRIKVKANEQSLENAVEDLNKIYAPPYVEIFAFHTKDGTRIVRKKLYYQIDKNRFTIVSIVNDEVLFIDTVHSPGSVLRDSEK